MDSRYNGTVFIGLKTVFDTVDNDILCFTSWQYGIQKNRKFSEFESYCSKRKSTVLSNLYSRGFDTVLSILSLQEKKYST